MSEVLQHTKSNQEYAGFWKRFLAYWVDTLIVSIINFALNSFTIIYSHGMNPTTISPSAGLIGLLIGIAYFFFFWVHEKGQTLGHRFLALRVVREDGQPIDIGTAVLRYIGYFVSSFVFCLGFLWVAWDPKKQGWHDKIARTVVVKTGEKSHTTFAVLLLIFPLIGFLIVFISLVVLGVVFGVHLVKNPDTYASAIFTDTNNYRTSHNIPAITEEEQICSFVEKRINELETKKSQQGASFRFDEHQGFNEDLANPLLWNAYFNNYSSPTEYYGYTEPTQQAPTIVSEWLALQDSQLKDANYLYGCVRADQTYTVFIVAKPLAPTPTPYVYNTKAGQQNYAGYPTLPPYSTPTMSPQEQAQLTGFQQEYSNAKATIQAGQQH